MYLHACNSLENALSISHEQLSPVLIGISPFPFQVTSLSVSPFSKSMTLSLNNHPYSGSIQKLYHLLLFFPSFCEINELLHIVHIDVHARALHD